MQDQIPIKILRPMVGAVKAIRALFNLRSDMDESGTVEIVRTNVDFQSANAWTLVFAILIASVGLNVNSTAVVIGAMLISPLMGPIVGAGLALGISDFELLKRALRNLAYAMLISVATSAIYFWISPLSEVQSELLSRTQPTFFDVMIAIFGGAAGIIALSRKERGNALPGVAIATALMPPLCTAGFGLANGEIKYVLGALYLFVINSVFICISTYAFVRYMKFQRISVQLKESERRIRQWMMAVATIVLLPSLFLAWRLQQETSFRSRANEFINREMRFPGAFIVNREIDYAWDKQKIILDLIGETLTEDQMSMAREKLKRYLIPPEALEIHNASLEENLEKRLTQKISTDSKLTAELRTQLSQKELELKVAKETIELSGKLTLEATTLMPGLRRVVLAEFPEDNSTATQLALVVWRAKPRAEQRTQLQKFLQQRLDRPVLKVVHSLEL